MAEARGTQSESGRYRYVRDLAEGGMGRVELALREEGRFRRVYAIKRLRSQFLDDPSLRAMFLEEARIAGLLRHPNLVSVIDTGEDERGPFLVMDFVEGVPLSRLIGRAAVTAEPVPTQVCVNLARQVAEGLHAAHELTDLDGNPLHLVHRDVSPQNVIVGFDGVARLTDFGIAKALGRAHRTSTGILKGKSGYFSPEQLQFEDPDRRSDIFCLGIVLYELLASRRLYGGDDPMAAAKRILREPPPDIAEDRPDAHPMLVKLLFEMLAKDPDQRPPDARAVSQVLEQIEMELLVDEEMVRPADWVNAGFADVRDRQRDELRAITHSGATVGEEAATEPDSSPTAPATPRSSGTSRSLAEVKTRPVRRWRGVVFAGAGLVIGVGAVVATAQLGWLGVAEPPPVIVVPATGAEAPSDSVTAAAPAVATPAAPSPAAVTRGPERAGATENEAVSGTPVTDRPEPERSGGVRRASGATAMRTERRPEATTEGEREADDGDALSATPTASAAGDPPAEAPPARAAPADSAAPSRRNPELMTWPERSPSPR